MMVRAGTHAGGKEGAKGYFGLKLIPKLWLFEYEMTSVCFVSVVLVPPCFVCFYLCDSRTFIPSEIRSTRILKLICGPGPDFLKDSYTGPPSSHPWALNLMAWHFGSSALSNYVSQDAAWWWWWLFQLTLFASAKEVAEVGGMNGWRETVPVGFTFKDYGLLITVLL